MKKSAPKNRTLTCSEEELNRLSKTILRIKCAISEREITDRIIKGDTFEVAGYLPKRFVNLLVLDPPYNLSKDYNGHVFKTQAKDNYQEWFSNAIKVLAPTLAEDATVYVCSDWRTSVLIAPCSNHSFASKIESLGSERKDAAPKPIGKTIRRIFGSVRFQRITTLMSKR